MKKILYPILVILSLIAIFGLFYLLPNNSIQESQQETRSIVFATHKIPLAAPYIIAKEKEFFKKNGLDVEMVYFTTGLETLHALTSNKAQFASTGVTPFVHFSFQRGDVKIINQVTLADDFQIIARIDSNINTLSDLQNKKIGYVKGTITQLAIINTLKEVGIEKDTYELIKLNQPLALPSALQNKELDAFCAWEPFITNTTNLIGADKIIIFGKEKGLHALPYLTMATDSFLENEANQTTIIAFQKALIDATDFIQQDRNKSIEIVSDITGMDKDQLKDSWDKYTFKISLEDDLLDELTLEKEWFDPKQKIDYINLIEPRYLKKANDEN